MKQMDDANLNGGLRVCSNRKCLKQRGPEMLLITPSLGDISLRKQFCKAQNIKNIKGLQSFFSILFSYSTCIVEY